MKRLRSLFFIIILFFFNAGLLSAQETEESKRKDVLIFGLESEISDLISRLQEENETDYNDQLLELFNKTKNPVIRENILMFFTFQKNDSFKQYALEVLANPFDYKKSTVLAVLSYIAEIKIPEASPLIRKILDGENIEFRDKAIQTLGKLNNPEDAAYLFEYMESEISGDEKQRLIIRQNIMAALGELKAVETWDTFVAIVQDTEENVMIRASAAVAIGNMEKSEVVPILAVLYEDTDPVLRTAAINGLSNFSTVEAVSVILESFKDSYYKVRLEAIAASEKQNLAEAVPYILYRAKNDPVDNVKLRSFEALGKLNAADSNVWLSSLVNDSKAVDKIRVKAAAVLLGNNFDLIYPDVEKIMIQALNDDKKTWIRYELGKIIAATANVKTASIASAYLAHKDSLTKSIGLDMFETNKYAELRSTVESIAADEKLGALQRRAKKILEK